MERSIDTAEPKKHPDVSGRSGSLVSQLEVGPASSLDGLAGVSRATFEGLRRSWLKDARKLIEPLGVAWAQDSGTHVVWTQEGFEEHLHTTPVEA